MKTKYLPLLSLLGLSLSAGLAEGVEFAGTDIAVGDIIEVIMIRADYNGEVQGRDIVLSVTQGV